MGRTKLVGLVIAGAILVAIAGCSGQEPSLDPTVSRTTAGATLWSLEGARSKTAPQLWTSPPQAINPSTSNTVCAHVGQGLSWNDAGKCAPRSLLGSKAYTPIAGIPSTTDFGRDPTLNAQSSPESLYPRYAQFGPLAGNDPLSLGSFFYSLRANYALWEQALAETDSLTDEGGTLLYPLLQVGLSGWRLPILLYVPALHDSSLNPR